MSTTDLHEPRYWRSFEDLENTPEFQERLHREFPEGASEFPQDDVSRRRFLGVVAAGVALAGMTSCRKPKQKILPFARRPENQLPGVARYYATAHLEHGYGLGTIVKSSDGRPTMIEGNPQHPVSLGGTSSYAIAEVLNLYDPARSKHPAKKGAHNDEAKDDHGHGDKKPDHAKEFAAALESRVAAWGANKGAGLHVLVTPTSSPTFGAQLDAFRAKYPQANVHSWSPLSRHGVAAGSTLAFGKPYEVQHQADAATIVVAVDSDFLEHGPEATRISRQFASRRSPETRTDKLIRLYAIESRYSLTGAAADHRFRVRSQEVADAMLALAAELQANHGVSMPGVDLAKFKASFDYGGKDWVPALAKDLAANRGTSLLICGDDQPALVRALVCGLNEALGNVGKTVRYSEMPAALTGNQTAEIQALCAAMSKGEVGDLVILGGNPVYNAPADLKFGQHLKKVKSSIHLGLFNDETGRACSWHQNAAHPLEAWGDALGYDGSLTLVQPLIAPLYHGITEVELLARMTGSKDSGYQLLQNHYKAKIGAAGFEAWWARTLHDGVGKASAASLQTPKTRWSDVAKGVAAHNKAAAASVSNMEAVFRADASMFDGRYANNAWMQEMPDPMSKLVWDNAALMSVKTAKAINAANGDLVEFTLGGRKLTMPVWMQPGMAEFSVQFNLGYGRDHMGDDCIVAKGSGFDTYKLRGTDAMELATGLSASKGSGSYDLVVTQDHGAMEGRAQVRENTLAGWHADPKFAPKMNPLVGTAAVKTAVDEKEHGTEAKPTQEPDINRSLWAPDEMPESHRYAAGYQWGMTIDLNACTGCNSCVVACQAENNIPTVGKEQVSNGREMHWLRIDRYYNGAPYAEKSKSPPPVPPLNWVAPEENPQVLHQMVPCMQCEKAPCEVVCPVAATTHSPEGLNDMVYNRCIGTRYCSNNCPFKVRRFNYLDFHGDVAETRKMQHNPDVTVRNRGVMEKCTYCVQRINGAKLTAKLESRKVRDGEIQPACASICPTGAITFGDINDKNSLVSKKKASTRNYGMLAEMNIKPRTTYLARIRNPNPELVSK